MYTYKLYNTYYDQFFFWKVLGSYLLGKPSEIPYVALDFFLGVDRQVLHLLLSKSAQVLVPRDLRFTKVKVPGFFQEV